MTDFVFPEDSGTGGHSSGEGDDNDAANFAAYADALGFKNYVKQGLGFTLDAGAPSLDISSGKAVVTDTSATTAQTGETRNEGVAFVAELDSRSGLSLTDSDVNHVFLDVDLSSDDSASIVINTTDSPPSQPYLKLGTVDTSADTVTELNRTADIADEVSLGNGIVDDGSGALSVATDGIGTDELDESANFSFSNLGATTITGDLDMSNNKVTNLEVGNQGGLTFNLDSSQSGQFMSVLFDNASGDNWAWEFINGSNLTQAFAVTNNSNNTDYFTVDGDSGEVSIRQGNLNLSNSNSIQDAGVDAIQFDGSANITIPNGDLKVSTDTILTTTDVIIGNNLNSNVGGGGNEVSIGQEISNGNSSSVAIGDGVTLSGANSVAIGLNAESNQRGVAIGVNSNVDNSQGATAVGRASSASGDNSVALARDATSSGDNSVALGAAASASGIESTALGRLGDAQNVQSVALGYNATAKADNAVAIGGDASVSTADTIVLGNDHDVSIPGGNLDLNSNKILGFGDNISAELRNISDTAFNGTQDFPGFGFVSLTGSVTQVWGFFDGNNNSPNFSIKHSNDSGSTYKDILNVSENTTFIPEGDLNVGSELTQPGTDTNPAIEIGNSGAGFFVNSSGEVVVVDEAGNTTTIS